MKPGASGPRFSLPCDLLVLLHLHRAVGTRRVWCLLPHTPSLALPVQLFPASCPGPSCLSLVSFTPRARGWAVVILGLSGLGEGAREASS